MPSSLETGFDSQRRPTQKIILVPVSRGAGCHNAACVPDWLVALIACLVVICLFGWFGVVGLVWLVGWLVGSLVAW